jgi:hypothetical protein
MRKKGRQLILDQIEQMKMDDNGLNCGQGKSKTKEI